MTQACINKRFRGYLPVVVDIETGGFNASTDAILEISAVILQFNDKNLLSHKKTISYHIQPFPGANLDAQAMAFTGIDPDHPFRFAKPEDEAFKALFKEIRKEVKATNCQRAIMVAHNANFDINFVNAAVERNKLKRNPFHPFSTIDTAALSAIFLGQTVLAKACESAKLTFDKNEAHSALYDAEKTAELFCFLTNQWQKHNGWDIINQCPILVE